MTGQTAERLRELTAGRVRFVHAIVVRAQVPSSAKAGDDAIVLEDGSIEGFVGGQCAESSVRSAALGVLARGESMLLRVLPAGEGEFPESPGAQVVVNPCLSGGALEIFLEPMLPPPVVQIVGRTPVADAIATISGVLGYTSVRQAGGAAQNALGSATAVVVASHGRDEIETIRSALAAEVPYIALVASRRRGQAVLDELGLDAAERERVSTPAGLDIGARTAPEVALSILAEVITTVRTNARVITSSGPIPSTTTPAPPQVIDAVCGMTVTVVPDTPHLVVEGADFWFCNSGCRDTYATAQPAGVVDSTGRSG
jgi:xanthine dehydrogenase accessory factor